MAEEARSKTMKYVFEYKDRSEHSLEDLLIWWGSSTCGHSMPAEERDIVCGPCDQCEPMPYSIEGMSFGFRPNEEIPITFRDPTKNIVRLLEPGDRIVFDPEARTMKVEP